jgi:hypothetical protein
VGLKNKIVVWFVKQKLKGSSMLKWLRKYPVLAGVAIVRIVSVGTILRFFGMEGWAELLTNLAQGVGLGLGDIGSPVSAVEVSGAVAGLLGVGTKVWMDHKKRRAAKRGTEA